MAFPSLMPEGVEHFDYQAGDSDPGVAFPSLMPEGVEHSLSSRHGCLRADSVSFADAGRR